MASSLSASKDLTESLLTSSDVDDEEYFLCREEEGSDVWESGVRTVQVYRMRWLVLLLLSLSSMTSAMLWITFSPIASHVEGFFHASSLQVNILSMVFIGAYLPMSLISSCVYHNFGVRNGMIFASGLNFASGAVRFLSATPRPSYAVLVLGQSLGALAQPFFTNLPARLGSLWFPKTERDLAVVIGSLTNAIGIMVGSVLPVFYTRTDDSGDETVDMQGLLSTEFWWTFATFVLVVFLFRDRPPTPPSLSESSRSAHPQLSLQQELKLLSTNRQFILLTITFGILGLSVFNTLLTLMEQLIKNSGYDSDDASWFLGWMLTSGIVSAMFFGVVLDRTHAYNTCLKAGFVGSMISFNAMLLALRPHNLPLLTLLFSFMGASMMPLLPIAIECACECTYPVSEDVSSGVLQSANQLSAPCFILGVSALLNRQSPYTTYTFEPAYVVFSVTSVLFVVGIAFYDGKYLRLGADRVETSTEYHGETYVDEQPENESNSD